MDAIIVETASRIFRDLGDPRTVAADAWRERLWPALEDSGLTLAWVPEAHGGGGAEIADGFAVLRVFGAFASPAPLAETLLAGWLLAGAGLAAPAGPMSLAPVRDGDTIRMIDGRLEGVAARVPGASAAAHLAVLCDSADGPAVALVETAACTLAPAPNLAGHARDEVTFTGATPLAVAAAPAGVDGQAVALMGAAARSAQMTGALEAILDLSVGYAGERVAFGRPLAKFQVIQHNLARLASETAAAVAASGAAADSIAAGDGFDERTVIEIAAAKIRVGEAAREGAAIAHQVHGAIGFTEEHVLHRYTRPLLAWRDDFGSESQWAARLGTMIAAGGADALWATITAE